MAQMLQNVQNAVKIILLGPRSAANITKKKVWEVATKQCISYKPTRHLLNLQVMPSWQIDK